MRKALELSIIIAPCFVMVSAYSFDTLPPAETNATSTSRKASSCCNNCTSTCRPSYSYVCPALRALPNSTNSPTGNFRSANTRRNSCPTAPLAPTIATFIIVFTYLFSVAKIYKKVKIQGHKIKFFSNCPN